MVLREKLHEKNVFVRVFMRVQLLSRRVLARRHAMDMQARSFSIRIVVGRKRGRISNRGMDAHKRDARYRATARESVPMSMERVSKAWEDDFLLIDGSTSDRCVNEDRCKGVTARTVHGKGFHRPLRPFRLPSGKSFDECILCIRARVAETWYRILYEDRSPNRPIHEWIVRVDEPDEYDAACCVGPMRSPHAYVGVLGPFPRYDETTLLVVPERGFKQICVEYKEIPRLLRRNERVGARPLGFHGLWRTTHALIYAGYVSRAQPSHPCAAVEDAYRKCAPHATCTNAAWTSMFQRCDKWIRSVALASELGMYPHCVKSSSCASSNRSVKQLVAFLREHITFLIEKDSQELLNAVRRVYPKWDEYVSSVRSACDAIRGLHKRKREETSVMQISRRDSWTHLTRDAAPAPLFPYFSSASLLPCKLAYENGCAYDVPEDLKRAAAWDAWSDRFVAKPLLARSDPVWFYMCFSCGDFKSVPDGGCRDVKLDMLDMKMKCYKKRTLGRRPTLVRIKENQETMVRDKSCHGYIIKRPFGTHVVHVDFNAFVLCESCKNVVVPLNVQNISRTEIRCANCSKQTEEYTCEICGASVARDAFNVRAFNDSVGLRVVRFCRAHAKPKASAHAEIWCLPLLLNSVYRNKKQ